MRIEMLLNEFGLAIDLCRKELSKIDDIQDDKPLRYALTRIYGRVLLLCCEIYTLLKGKYPQGAISLSRQVYEALVIIDVLIQENINRDFDLSSRFIDAAEIAELKYQLLLAELIKKDKRQYNQQVQNAEKETEKEVKEYQDKYQGEKRYKDYWWAGCETFNQLAEKSKYGKWHMYKLASMNTHLNAYSSLKYLDPLENQIVIGEQEEGIETPLWYTSICLAEIINEINKIYKDICPQNVCSALNKLAVETTKFSQKKYRERMKMQGFTEIRQEITVHEVL